MDGPANDVHPMHMSDAAEHLSGMARIAKVRPRLKPEPRYGRNYIRAWRQHRGLSLERLADRIQRTHATLSRIERGLNPYTQDVLEAIAEALGTDVPSLLVRDPSDPDGIWTIWDQAKPAQRRQIIEVAKTLLKTA